MQTVLRKQEMQIANLKWLLFPYRMSDFFFKINRVQAVDEIDTLQVWWKSDHKCRLNRVNKKCKFSTLNGYFSLTDCPIFFFQNQLGWSY